MPKVVPWSGDDQREGRHVARTGTAGVKVTNHAVHQVCRYNHYRLWSGTPADDFKKLLDLDTVPKGITVEPVTGANPTRTGRA